MSLIAGGYAEIGCDGLELQKKLRIAAGDMPIAGPNTLGFLNAHAHLNVTFYPKSYPGNVSFLSQSGGIGLGIKVVPMTKASVLQMKLRRGTPTDTGRPHLTRPKDGNASRHWPPTPDPTTNLTFPEAQHVQQGRARRECPTAAATSPGPRAARLQSGREADFPARRPGRPRQVREALAVVLIALANDAATRAHHAWRRHKAPMAAR